MIDAYEIGIQLALQDDVSAGLSVIARELAEVDRAVAASSAGLAALVQSAEGAVRAMSAVAAVRPPTPAAQAGDGEARGLAVAEAPRAAVAVPAVRVEERPAAVVREPGVAAPAALRGVPRDPVATSSVVVRTEAATPGAVAVPKRVEAGPVRAAGSVAAGSGRVVSAAVPQRSRATEPSVVAGPGASGRVPEPGRPAGAQPRREGAAQGTVVARVERHGGGAQRQQGMPGRRDAVAAPRPDSARVEAALPRAGRGGAAERVADGRSFSVAARDGGVAAVAAPAAPRPEAFLPRGAAPQAEDRERGQAGGGTVMLDGRMVGYWLAEHMAREASRPPAGTSFFDPRQGPAWTPSGAL